MKYSSWLPVLLGFLSAVGPVSTDMYLPAFPAIEASLHSPLGSAQMTLATWFAGLAVGQITQGALSDRWGRRVPLLLGTGIYTIASAGCALAPDLTSLSILRAIAAFGGSASMVVPRAVIRDLADGHAAARLLSRLMLVMGAAPILAPTLGGVLLQIATWQMIFWVCALYGALGTLLVWLFLPDTMPQAMRAKLGLAALLARYITILRERSFLAHAAQGSFAMFGLFAYIGGSPVIISLFGLAPRAFGTLLGFSAAGFIIASQINARILPRFGSERVLSVATRIYLLATIVLAVEVFAHVGFLPAVIAPIFVAVSCMGFVMPNATVGAMSRHAVRAGSASALMGTLQFLLAAVSGTLVGVLADGTMRPLAVLLVIGAALANVADAYRPRRAVVVREKEPA